MFYIPETKEEIKARLEEINAQVTSVGADNISHFYAQALMQAYFLFDETEEAA